MEPAIEKGMSVWRRFESYGFIGGICVGLLVGVLVSGPNFQKWDIDTSVWVILGSTVIGGLIGFLASSIAAGSLAHGADYDDQASADNDQSVGSGDGHGGGDG